MRNANPLILFVLILVSLFLAGCACEKMPLDDDVSPVIDGEVDEQEQVEAAEEMEEEDEEDATVQEEKQLALGSTDIKEEEATIVSDVICDFEEENPKKFSFKVLNNEQKEWVFRSVSYSDREKYDHPIVVLNALQVTDAQMISACGKKSISPGQTAVCDFDLVNDVRVSRFLRTGLTPLGSENKNTLCFKTVEHAIEIKFLCE
jgi:hypothetical protein